MPMTRRLQLMTKTILVIAANTGTQRNSLVTGFRQTFWLPAAPLLFRPTLVDGAGIR